MNISWFKRRATRTEWLITGGILGVLALALLAGATGFKPTWPLWRNEARDAYECEREVGSIGYRVESSGFLETWGRCLLARGYTTDEVVDAIINRNYGVDATARALGRIAPGMKR